MDLTILKGETTTGRKGGKLASSNSFASFQNSNVGYIPQVSLMRSTRPHKFSPFSREGQEIRKIFVRKHLARTIRILNIVVLWSCTKMSFDLDATDKV